jgi:hypothetical protein
MRLLGERCGLTLESVVDDSVAFQFWGSELYLRDLPLTQGEEYVKPEQFFEPSEIVAFENEAKALNAKHRGDQAIFFLRKPVRSSQRNHQAS